MWYTRPAAILKPLGLYGPTRRLWRQLRRPDALRLPESLPAPEAASAATAAIEPTAPAEAAPPPPAVALYPSHAVHPILTQPLPATEPGPLSARVKQVITHPHFSRLIEELSAWPEDSTISGSERAMLHWLITAGDLQNALEIGTYFAGTTRLMAASMEAKGSGRVHSIDPYGADRAPGLFRRWPGGVADRVTFSPKYSTEYLMLMNRLPDFDLVLVDGNHSYANAFHDISASVDNAAADGVLIMDNAEQPDVIDATRDYLRLNPHLESALVWQEGRKARYGDTFGYDGSSSCFAVIQVNKRFIKANKTYTYLVMQLPGLALGGMSLAFEGRAAVRGVLSLSVHLRAISRDAVGTPEMFDLYEQHDLPIGGRESGGFEVESKLALPDRAADFVVWAEFSLRLKTSDDVGFDHFTLKLGARPLKIGRNFLDEA